MHLVVVLPSGLDIRHYNWQNTGGDRGGGQSTDQKQLSFLGLLLLAMAPRSQMTGCSASRLVEGDQPGETPGGVFGNDRGRTLSSMKEATICRNGARCR